MGITETWSKSTARRMARGGDLYRRPLTRAEMTAPLEWHERQMAVVRRYGELEDGTVGFEVVRAEEVLLDDDPTALPCTCIVPNREDGGAVCGDCYGVV